MVEDFYYTGPLDYLLFEGELAHGSELPPTKVTKKKPSDIAGETTWTGFGYMLVFEGSTLTFDIPEIHRTMHYNPVVRYAHLPTHPNTWETVSVELVRVSGPPDPMGLCAGADDGPVAVSLPSDGISQEVPVPFCLEAGLRYQIRLTFDQYDPAQPSQANIYVDSVRTHHQKNNSLRKFLQRRRSSPLKAGSNQSSNFFISTLENNMSGAKR